MAVAFIELLSVQDRVKFLSKGCSLGSGNDEAKKNDSN